jgi:hypothetical protein
MKKLKRSFLVLSLSALPVLALASGNESKSSIDLLLGQQTYHFHEYWNEDFCTVTGGEQECQPHNDSQELIGAHYSNYSLVYLRQNSLREESFILTRVWDYDLNPWIRPWAAAGFASGYEKVVRLPKYKGLVPMGYFGLDLHPSHDRFGLLATWLPDSFVGVGLRVKLR